MLVFKENQNRILNGSCLDFEAEKEPYRVSNIFYVQLKDSSYNASAWDSGTAVDSLFVSTKDLLLKFTVK